MDAAGKFITFTQPGVIAFGEGALKRAAADLLARRCRRILIISSSVTRNYCDAFAGMLESVDTSTYAEIDAEPTITAFHDALGAAQQFNPDAVVGLGGGSPMDVAKLVAAILDKNQKVADVFGIDKVASRKAYLVCIPTTSGTGSEVSPNSILLDEAAQLKKGVVSRYLMPDAAYVDPSLTLSVPPAVTASTGMDALTHCIEAYANRFAHPVIDLYALEGIRRISANIVRAYTHGDDLDARTNLSLGSMYGGICLGPVNTGAVHALAYPLGGEFKIAHGVSNSMLLPYVLDFNLSAAPDRYATIARAMGVAESGDDLQVAKLGLEKIKALSKSLNIPSKLSEFNVPESAIERLAASAMTVTRLLERNVREVKLEDAIGIYRRAL